MIKQFTSTSKINLFLDILRKDPADGYHELESIFYEIPYGDDFCIFHSEKDECIFYNDPQNLILENNTVSKTLKLFKEQFNIQECFRIEIVKKVPMGAGVGGGSGDAGALLKFLCSYFNKSIKDCLPIAQQVGSDVPFFLYGGSALVEGKGERITPLSGRIDHRLKGMIITPNIHIATKKAFESISYLIEKERNKKNIKKFEKKMVWGLDFLSENVYNIFNDNIRDLSDELFAFRENVTKKLSPDLIFLTGSGSSFVLFFHQEREFSETSMNLDFIQSCSAFFI